MDRLLGGAIPALVEGMRYRMARQGVLAGNVVNADTPGFRRTDLEFAGLLENEAHRIRRTHPDHLGAAGRSDHRLTRGPRGSRPDGNGVNLEQEVIQLNRNAGAFERQAAVLTRLLAIRRIAATGEGG